MGIDSQKAPPLPAPTESESPESPTDLGTDFATELSKQGDDRSSYSLPDDGTPVTIKTRGHRPNKSQTSLLIEYFEGGKHGLQGGSRERRPSVRVRLTPSKSRGQDDHHIQITETRSARTDSPVRRATSSPPTGRSELDMTDPEDARSMNSYASATEESNVSRNPIEIEIDSSRRRRNKKVSSPLIPASDSKLSYIEPNMSDISAIPTDSFLDGCNGNTTLAREENRARSPIRANNTTPATPGTATGGSVTDKWNRSASRNASRDRSASQAGADRASRAERRHKSKSRSMDATEKGAESKARRRSKGSHKESVVSGIESSVLSSQLSPSHRSYDSYTSSKVSINNPKLLETVEDAIRRLILPELDALKRETSKRESKNSRHRDSLQRDSLSSLTSASRDELSVTSRRRSADTSQSTKSRDRRNREARNDLSPQNSLDEASALDGEVYDEDHTPRRDRDRMADAALGAVAAGAVGAALRSRSREGDEKRQRRRRRGETPKRGHSEGYTEGFDETEHEVTPPMPLSSEINPSEMTRTSILSAETDRPHSASEEMAPVREVPRGKASVESIGDTPTPTRSPGLTLQQLGTQHANVSHGDLKALPRKGPGAYKDESEPGEFRRRHLSPPQEEYDEYNEESHLAEPGMYDEEEPNHSFFGHQDVPAPLRYVPYQQERRGLSPIQSVSGFTEGESDVQGHRDSRFTQTASELSSPEKHDEEGSALSSGLGYRNTTYTDDSELDHGPSGQAVHNVGDNPQMVHQNFGPESAVASLIEGSALNPSLMSGASYRNSQVSYDEARREPSSAGVSPVKEPVDNRHDVAEKRDHSPSLSQERPTSAASRQFSEYDLNEYGQKVPQTKQHQPPTASEAAITSAALERAAATALKRKNAVHKTPSRENSSDDFVGEGVSRGPSFKERAKDGYRPNAAPRHSVDRLSDYDQPSMGASGLPDMDHPMPEIGYGYDASHRDLRTPSVAQESLGGSQHENQDQWPITPTQENEHSYDRAVTPKASRGFGLTESAAAATIATAGALAANHSRQPSGEQDNEWYRTSSERKRDTLITNPYEGSSPIANLPGLDSNMLSASGFGADEYRGGFHTGSPVVAGGDEGYISAAPNEGGAFKGKGIDISEPPVMGAVEDPFYSTKQHTRQLSGLSQGMTSPFYDAATGTGIDRIQSKDIIALMEHLMVRDAQRSARDTEILVTLVRSAAEMRNSFEDIKRILADTEEQIIMETKDNTERTVKRHVGGPRPLPGSSGRSIQGGSQAGTYDDLPAKKRNFLRRALQGLSAKGTSDLARIEDMLMQLLTDVDVLKHQTASGNETTPQSASGMNLHPNIPYEQDRGYEPEGNAGTSTASHASQSGHLSLPQSRGTPLKQGYDRKFSDHRISTVPEGDEDEFEETYVTATNHNSPQGGRMTPGGNVPRGGSVPLATPPQTATQHNASHSQENTPRTDDGKKHKSRGSSSFFPKISRWSETTTSSLGKVFRSSGNSKKNEEFLQHQPSRSGSQLGDYDYHQTDPYGDDKLHSGFSTQDLPATSMGDNLPHMASALAPAPLATASLAPAPLAPYTPEDPKYKAHRNSLNLQHPQPRPGQTERFRTALEYSAQDFSSPMSPRSADWAGSVTSLHRLNAQNNQRYRDNGAISPGPGGDEYNWGGASSPAAQGPPRPPKEPLESHSPRPESQTPAQHARVSQLQQKRNSPLPYHTAEGGYGNGTANHSGNYRSGSPKLENRNLSAALGVPTRRPSGPRAMTPTEDAEERRRKRDTFGTVASPRSLASQESETF
ncbi:hypothetical protein DL763_004888 [Monosporascus cannonballus]|nr:hypothetical protein DL763_004888 [Monosporascus cannonballus]